MKQKSKIYTRYLRWSFLSALAGILAGGAASVFLILLQGATNFREHHPFLILFLPLAGLATGLAYHRYGREVADGASLILDEIHDPKNKVPLRMAPLILLSTIVTHLFGGSAGREGTAVQMGASLADQLSSVFRMEKDERTILLVAGAGAGFGAAIGAPWAGMIFGMEVISVGKLQLFAWWECFVASFVGYYVTLWLQAPHTHYPPVENIVFDLRTFFFVVIFGCFCGLTAWAFVSFTHGAQKIFKRLTPWPPFRPMLGGLILVLMYHLEGSYAYAGLGLPVIQDAFAHVSNWHLPVFKSFFTAVTIGSGFKGGEFIPLVFIGTTLGSFLSVVFSIAPPLLAALGFAAVFAGAANTPIVCTLMAMEIFGPRIGVYALMACFFSYYCSGHKSIYRSQRIYTQKHKKLLLNLQWLGELPKRFFNSSKPSS